MIQPAFSERQDAEGKRNMSAGLVASRNELIESYPPNLKRKAMVSKSSGSNGFKLTD